MDDREQRFERVVGEVAAPLHRFLTRRMPRDEVDDVLADAMLVIWRRLEEVPPDDVLPWCYGVARNCLANATRAGRRRARLEARIQATAGPTDAAVASGADASAEAAAWRVHAALDRLTDDERELVRLWAWEELGASRIAVVLGITPNAASIRLHRARRRLAALLEADERSGPRPDMDG